MDRERALGVVREFLGALEEGRTPSPLSLTSDARLVALDSGRARALGSALEERRAQGHQPLAAGSAPLSFDKANLSLVEDRDEESERVRARVRVRLSSSGSGGLEHVWFVYLQVTEHGPAITELATADGALH